MNSVEFGRYKRIVQYFWDPEPRNDAGLDSSIWCLGEEYSTSDECVNPNDRSHKQSVLIDAVSQLPARSEPPECKAPDMQFDSRASQANEKASRGWPAAFLDDFESKIWLTYRSNFPVIPKSEDPNAPLSMTMSVRLRSQIVEPHGFSSDTGWGCMIRSGQSLLANTLSILILGRGMKHLDQSRNSPY
jgi:cysteine protease ATG4